MSQTISFLRRAVPCGSSQDGAPLIVGVRVSTCPSAKQTLAIPSCRKWTFGNCCDGADRYQFSVSLSNGGANGTLAESANAIVAAVPRRLLTVTISLPATSQLLKLSL